MKHVRVGVLAPEPVEPGDRTEGERGVADRTRKAPVPRAPRREALVGERLEIVESFPMTSVGKVSKKDLREDIARKLASETASGGTIINTGAET